MGLCANSLASRIAETSCEMLLDQRKISRERSKSAPYQRLKNSKRTSKCQSIYDVGPFDEIFCNERKSHNAEKTERGPLGIFQHPQNSKKIEGGPFGEFIFKKMSHNAEKTQR